MTWEDELRSAKGKLAAPAFAKLLGVKHGRLKNWLHRGNQPDDITKEVLRRRMSAIKPVEKK